MNKNQKILGEAIRTDLLGRIDDSDEGAVIEHLFAAKIGNAFLKNALPRIQTLVGSQTETLTTVANGRTRNFGVCHMAGKTGNYVAKFDALQCGSRSFRTSVEVSRLADELSGRSVAICKGVLSVDDGGVDIVGAGPAIHDWASFLDVSSILAEIEIPKDELASGSVYERLVAADGGMPGEMTLQVLSELRTRRACLLIDEMVRDALAVSDALKDGTVEQDDLNVAVSSGDLMVVFKPGKGYGPLSGNIFMNVGTPEAPGDGKPLLILLTDADGGVLRYDIGSNVLNGFDPLVMTDDLANVADCLRESAHKIDARPAAAFGRG